MKNIKSFINFIILVFCSQLATGQFVQNKGQVVDDKGKKRPDVYFTYQSNGSKLFFFKDKVTYVLFETFHKETKESKKARKDGDTKKADNISLRIKQQHVDFNFLNSNKNSEIVFQNKASSFQNFYLSHCPEGITKVPEFSKVTYKNIYDHIDIVFKSTTKGVKYDIILHPGANINDVKFEYDGVNNIKFKKDKIIFETDIQNLEENIPLSFIAESGEPIDIYYKDLKNGVFGFESETDFKNKKVVIDPVLTWATYFEQTVSPNASYIGQNTHVDANGNFYFQIGTYNSDLPSQNPGGTVYLDPSYTGSGIETYFAQFDANRNLIWTTYLGGSGSESNYYDHGLGSFGGSFFIAGETNSADFPVMNQGGGAFYQATKTTGVNAFFSKFNISTGAMQHSTYLGYIDQIVMDVSSSGNLAIVGVAGSSSDAATVLVQNRPGAYNQATFGGSNDVFVAQFNASTCVQNWGTFVGGAEFEGSMGVAYDNSNNLFLLNRAIGNSSPFVNPGGGAYYDNTTGGSYDIWFVKFNSSGSMVWSTLYGGAGLEGLSYSKITVTSNNHIVATTSTRSTAMATTNPGGGAYFQSAPGYLTNGNGGDPGTGFMVRFNNNGVVQHATYMGHPTSGNGSPKGNIPGPANSHYFLLSMPTAPVYPVSCSGPDYCSSYTAGSSTTGYIMELDASYNLVWDSYLYSADRVFGESMTSDITRSRVYVTGSSDNGASPTVNPGGGAYYDNTLDGTTRAYNIMEFSTCVSETNTTSTAAICENGLKALTSSGAGGGTWSVVSGGGTIAGTTYTPANISSATTVTVRYVDGCGTGTNRAFTVNPLPTQPGTITGSASICNATNGTYSIAAVANASSYTWSYSGTGTVTGTGTSVTLNATTNGTLSVRSVNGCGTSTARTRAITVTNVPAQPGTISGSSVICSSSQTYSVTAVAGATSYAWSYSGGGTPSSTTNSVTFTPTSSGTLTIRAVNSCGNSTARNLAINVATAAPATPGAISGVSPVCTSTSQTYSIAAVAGASSYTWSYSGGGTATSTTTSVTFTPTTSGNLTVTATNACGTSSASSRAIVVDATAPAAPSAIAGNTTICSSAQTYSVTNVAGVTYAWTYSGGGTPVSTTNSVTFTPTSAGTLSVTATNACGTSSATSQAIAVDNATPATPGTISGSNPVCRASSQTYTIAAVAGASSYAWNYSGGGTATSTTTSVTFSPTSTGILSVTATNACGTSTASNLSITVDSTFTPIIVSSSFDMCVGNSRTLVGSPVGGTFSIVSGGAFANISGSTLNATAVGTVQIRYRIVNACGNMDQTQNINIVSVANAAITSSIADMCVNDLRMLTATPVGTGGSWSVISGPGYIGLNDTLTSTGAGTVQVRYQYSSACGVSADTVSINVNPLPNVTITSGANDMCAGEAKTLTATPLGGTWTIVTGGGSINAGDYIAPAVASPTTVTLRYDYTSGSCSDFDSFSFTVNPSASTPSVVIPPAGGDTICAGSSITINASITGAGNTIAWYTNNNPIPNTASGIPIAYGTSMTDNPSVFTTYYVFGNSPQGCNSTTYDSVNIYMFAPSTPATAITASSDTVCSGQATTLTLSGGSLGNGGAWRWYETSCGNGGVIGSGTSISVNPTVTSTYFVRAEGSCDTSACVQYTITVQSSVDASITLPDSVCLNGGSVDLSAYINTTSTQGGTWSGPGMTDSIFDPLAAGIGVHSITYTVGTLPCQDADTRTIRVYNVTAPSITDDFVVTTAGNTDTLDLESNDATIGTISIAVLPSNGAAYVDNNKVIYLANPEYRGNDTLTYVVCDNGCLAVCDTATVIMQVDLNIFFDNIDENNNIGKIGVTPNGDGVNDVLYIDDLYNYPNNKITIYNRWGDEIFTKSPYNNDWAPDEGLTKGTYFFVLEFIDTKELYKGIIHLEK